MGDTVKEMALPFLLRRVELRNYRSIEHCDVELGPLMFLVGPNGSGKSNFLDALRFVSDCASESVNHALWLRGGFRQVCRSTNDSQSFSIKLTLSLSGLLNVEYMVEIGENGDRFGFEIRKETFRALSKEHGYDIAFERSLQTDVQFTSSSVALDFRRQLQVPPEASPSQLYLKTLGGWPEFQATRQMLANMAFYSPSLAPMREHQSPDPGDRLARDGANIASVIRTLRQMYPDTSLRIQQYLSAAIPRLLEVTEEQVGEKVTLKFGESGADGQSVKTFYASSISDGTLRLLALLVAIFQRSERAPISLVGVEEPEMGLHPGAAGVLFDSLSEASYSRQVIATSHSVQLLDRDEVDVDTLLAVSAESGATVIGPIDDRQKEILRRKLGTAGELLRDNLLSPNPSSLAAASIEG